MPTPETAALIAKIETLRSALQEEPVSPAITAALHHCERLQLALLQSHAEGLRFAAYTLNRLMQQPGANLRESSKNAARELREGLDTAGLGA